MTVPAREKPGPLEDVFLRDNYGPTIAEHTSLCTGFFEKYMALSNLIPDPTLIDDQLARFTLWASNMDVFGPAHVSLDYRLRYSPTVVEIIHQLLQVICNSLKSLQPLDDPPQTPIGKKRRLSGSGNAEVTKRVDDSSDTDSDEDQVQKNVTLVTFTIGETVTRLFRLSNAIRKSAKESRINKIRDYTEDKEANNAVKELRLYTECYIRFRFPQAPDALRSALVEANALRLKRLFYQRSHRRRIALSVQLPQTAPRSVQLPKVSETVSAVHFTGSLETKATDKNPKQCEFPSAPKTYATTARQTAVQALIADSIVETPRAKSILVNNKLSFPPVPETSECPYCGVILDFTGTKNSTRWNDHVTRDLEPFVCVFTRCINSKDLESSFLTFETSKAWMDHMHSAHGHVWECRAPCHNPIIFEREVDFQEHSREEHDVPEAHLGTLSGAARRPAQEKVQECPFGDEFLAPENAESNNVFLNEALRLHVTNHMKEIALLALQKLPSDNDEQLEDVASDASLQNTGKCKLRNSMYSILDDHSLNLQDFPDEGEESASKMLENAIVPSVGRLELEDRDSTGNTKLHRAVRDNDLVLAQSLLEEGANVRSIANNGMTVLHYASLGRFEDVDMMKLLLEFHASDLVDLQDENGQTPLHYAAKGNFTGGIELLLDHGASMKSLDKYGLSPYLWAVISGNRNATQLLLSLGTDINSLGAGANRRSALGWAASMGHSSMAEFLVKTGASVIKMTQITQVSPLEGAAACGDLFTVRLLLDCGADPNYRDRDGWSPIHWAAEEGHWDVVLSLLNYGANINAVSSYGTSTLHCAANGGHHKIVSELLQRGADPLKSSCHGWTALHHAAFMGYPRVVKTLLESDRMTTSPPQDNHGWSVLHLAAHRRHLGTVKALLSSPIMLGTQLQSDENGLLAEEWLDLEFESHSYKTIGNLAFHKSRCCRSITKLRLAVYNNNSVMTDLLLDQGCYVDDTNSGRRTALYYAAIKGHIPLLNMLLEKGANPNIIPTGRRAWEEFIFDYRILRQLQHAGYTQRNLDPALDHEIRLAFTQQEEPYRLGRLRSQPSLEISDRGSESVEKAEDTGSRLTRIWKRLRGQ